MIFQKAWDKLSNDSEFKKILVNINWLFLDRAIQMLIAFFVGVLVIRYLGPQRYGVLSYAIAVVMFFGIFAKLGLDAIVVRELVTNKVKKEVLLGTVFYMKLFGSFLAIVLAIVAVAFIQDNSLMTLAVAVVSFGLIFQSTDVIDYWFQANVVSKYIAYARSFAYISSAIIKIYLVSVGADLVWFVAVVLIESILIAIGLIIAYFRNRGELGRWIFDRSVARGLLKDSWPLIFSAVAVMVYMRIDQIMIGSMLGYEALGNYSVAVNLSEMWYFIPTIITASVFPAIIKAKEYSEKLYYDRLQKLYDTMVLLAVSVAIPMTFLSNWIITFLYGGEYYQAGGVLMIYVWTGVFVFLGVARAKWIIAENLQKYVFYFTVSAAIVNIILNIFLIRFYGINGAAFATLASFVVSVLLAPLMIKQMRQHTYMQLKSFIFFRRLLK